MSSPCARSIRLTSSSFLPLRGGFLHLPLTKVGLLNWTSFKATSDNFWVIWATTTWLQGVVDTPIATTWLCHLLSLMAVESTSNCPPPSTRNEEVFLSLPGLGQAPFESKYHWLCRRKFIEDHKSRYSLERAVCLSMVWSNINFLGCKYSDSLTELTRYYPVPEEHEISRWLEAHPDILQEDHNTSSGSTETTPATKISAKRTLSDRDDSPPQEDKSSLPSKISKLEKDVNPNETNDDLPFEVLTHQLDSFIAMIRQKQNQSDPPQDPNTNNNNNYAFFESRREVVELLAGNCFCRKCYQGSRDPYTFLEYLVSKYKLDMEFEFLSDVGTSGEPLVGKLFLNRYLVLTLRGSVNETVKTKMCQMFLKEIFDCQNRLEVRPICKYNDEIRTTSNENKF